MVLQSISRHGSAARPRARTLHHRLGRVRRYLGERLTPLGSYALRDISAVQPTFGLPEENTPAGNEKHDATHGGIEVRPARS